MTPAIFGIAGARLTAEERAFFHDCDPAGYILFGRNIENRDQLLALTTELRALHGRERLIVSIDQEGGRVARMRPPHWLAAPPPGAFAELYRIAPISAIEAARVNAQLVGQDLAEMGISLDYWPLLDVAQPGAHEVIGDRALGEEPMQVAALGRAILDGLGEAGVAGCIKHMPGHGRAPADSHAELPVVTASRADLERDLAPFRTLATTPVGMSCHVLFPAWDEEHPATLSAQIIEQVIRGQIGFDGLLLTDDIDMAALAGDVPTRAAQAVAAGCDIVLNCWARLADMVGIAERLPVMNDMTRVRLDRALANMGAVPAARSPDRDDLLAKREALLALACDAA